MNLREFYDRIPLGVCIVKRCRMCLEILYANNALARMMDWQDGAKTLAPALTPSDLIGRELDDAWSSGEVKAFARKLKGMIPPRDYTLPFYDGHGPGKRWVRLTIEEGTFGDADAFILWVTDISASKEAEEELRHAVEAADAAADMKANFLATMSHEIRTPMQSIYGLLELIGEENPPSSIMNMVNTAKNSASGLLEILDDILDFAKMDANKMELDTFEVPVRTLIYGIIEALSIKTHGKSVELKHDIDQSVPFVVIGDPKRLRQVILNLTGNALKFTTDGSVTIRVTTGTSHVRQPHRGVALRFEIVDTGIGLSPEAQERLFKPFSQADNSTSRKFGGTGLGLSICRALVELMGGKIGVTSTEGEGSTFWFEIPTEEVGTETTTVALPQLDGLSVLSVEDHPQGAKEIVRSLESMGAKVESCPTYKEGLELARRRPFDVGIIDQGLPDGLGIDLIREIMNLRPFMGLIMYTARDDSGLQHSLTALGVKYLTKPASRLGLGEAVKDAARKSSKINIEGSSRLLIAEDTESVRDVLRRQLEKLCVKADFVSTGKEALKALETGRYGILFTDLHMPEMDGYQLIETLRTREESAAASSGGTPQHFPVVALTADVQMAQRQVYLNHGFDECLLKPVSLGQFRRLLIRWGLLDDSESPANEGAVEKSRNTPAHALPPAVDLEAMRAQMGAVDEGTIDMLRMFVDMTEPLIARIQGAHEHSDFHDLREAAHSLKGGARSACCNVLGDIAAQLQDDAEAKKETCTTLIEEVLNEFERVRTAVKTLKAA